MSEIGAIYPTAPIITIPKTVTHTVTRYKSKFQGIITQWYKVEMVKDKDGNMVEVTRIVDQITVPIMQDKTKAFLVDTSKLKRSLRKVIL